MNNSLDVAKCEGNLLFLNIALALLSDVLISKHIRSMSQVTASREQGWKTTFACLFAARSATAPMVAE
jgi:hypothetical protein